jgi:hypothetical protein
MNRVVLCGRLAERPRLSASSSGLAVAALLLQVPRQGSDPGREAMDEIHCLAFDTLAQRLHLWGEPGLWVNLEGWLLSAVFLDDKERPYPGCRVAVDAAYWLDPKESAHEGVLEETPLTHGEEMTAPDAVRGAPGNVPASVLTWVRNRLAHWTCLLTGAGQPVIAQGKAGT